MLCFRAFLAGDMCQFHERLAVVPMQLNTIQPNTFQIFNAKVNGRLMLKVVGSELVSLGPVFVEQLRLNQTSVPVNIQSTRAYIPLDQR